MNEFFVPGSVPATNAPGASATIRAEFASVAAAFDKLPTMAGNADEFVVINPTGTGLASSGIVISDMVTATGNQALTNKMLSWAGNTWVGFGNAATKDAGTGAGEVLLLAENAKLPVLNGSNLTNLDPTQLGVVGIASGGTGAITLGAAQTALGIDLKADAFNASLSGAPVCATPADGDNSARIANTLFVNRAVALVGGLTPSNAAPLMNGAAGAGVALQASRSDHVHPVDTSRAPLASPAFTGNPTAPTPTLGDNDTSIATTAFVIANAATVSNAIPLTSGVAAPGVSAQASRADHVHPAPTVTAAGVSFTPAGGVGSITVQAAIAELDSEKASLASPAFTGNPTAPTPATIDNATSVATTAFVQAVIAAQPAGMGPSNATPLINGTASPGVGVVASRDDHIHPTDTTRAAASTLTSHTSDTANPHSTTKTQVGLGNVDNTSNATERAAVATLTNKTLDTVTCKLGAIGGLLKATAGAVSAAVAGTDYVSPGGALGTPASGNLANCTFPTLNQNTTGTAANATNISDGAVSTAAKIAANVVGVAKLAREGTAGYVLTSGGAGADPSYMALPASGVTSVGGYTGPAVTNAQVAASAAAHWGATPSFPGHTHSYAARTAINDITSATAGSPHTCTRDDGTTFTFTTTVPDPGACLHPHSLVETPDSHAFICDIRPGDVVLTPSGFRSVIGSWESSLGSRQLVSVNNGPVVTPGHLFPLSGGGWAAVDPDEYENHDKGQQHPVKTLSGMCVIEANTVEASTLKLGDMVVTHQGPTPVTSIEFFTMKASGLPVFSLVIADETRFYSDGLAVATLGAGDSAPPVLS